MKITSITVGLSVQDLERSARWYQELFDIKEAISPVDGVLEMEIGPVWLQLYEGKGIESDTALRFGVRDIERAHKRVKKLDIPAEDITEVPGVIRYFDLRDPDGHGLSFYEMIEK